MLKVTDCVNVMYCSAQHGHQKGGQSVMIERQLEEQAGKMKWIYLQKGTYSQQKSYLEERMSLSCVVIFAVNNKHWSHPTDKTQLVDV